LQQTLQGKLVCVFLLGLFLCRRHDCFLVCFELVVVGRIDTQHKRKDRIVGAETNWTMLRRGYTRRSEEYSAQVNWQAVKVDGKTVVNGSLKRYSWRVVGLMVTARERSASFGPSNNQVQGKRNQKDQIIPKTRLFDFPPDRQTAGPDASMLLSRPS
jgi:hypothetical protein